MEVFCGYKPPRAKDTAIALRAICEALKRLQGLEVMKRTFHLMSADREWDVDEAGILDEINRARRSRQG